MSTVAVIQPYFVPYAGYFRLFAAADIVVMFDCVQFPRRGWVHRNQIPIDGTKSDWLTLPIAKAPFDARITDLHFKPDPEAELATSMRRFPLLADALKADHPIVRRVLALNGAPVATYISELVTFFSQELRLEKRVVRSSNLAIPPELRGQERVIAIAETLGAERYVNPSGGRALYDPDRFRSRGIELVFLTPYRGSLGSILVRTLTEPPAAVAAEIVDETVLVP